MFVSNFQTGTMVLADLKKDRWRYFILVVSTVFVGMSCHRHFVSALNLP